MKRRITLYLLLSSPKDRFVDFIFKKKDWSLHYIVTRNDNDTSDGTTKLVVY